MVKWKRRTALFFVSQLTTMVGSMLVQYAIIWHISQVYQSGMMVMLSTLCGFLPQVIISVFAGVWADRFSRRALIIMADIGIAAATLGVAMLFMYGFNSVWLLMGVSALRSLGQGVQSPAVSAFVADIVPKDKLMKVNGLMSAMQGIVALVPIALGGVLYAIWDLYSIFYVDVATAVIGVVLLCFVRTNKDDSTAVQAPAEEKKKTGYFTDLKAGVKYVFSNKFMRLFFLYYALFCFAVTPVALLSPLQATRSFGADAWRLPAIELSYAVGMIVMGFVVGVWSGCKSRTKTIGIASFLQGLTIALIGVVPLFMPMSESGFGIYLGLMLISGCIMPYMNTPAITVLQETADPQMLGRVFGFVQVAMSLAAPLGMLFFGPLSDAVQIEWLLIFTGIGMVVMGLMFAKSKTLRQYKDYAYTPPAEAEKAVDSEQ